MTPERWQQIKLVFDQADGLPPADRPNLLNRLCAEDADLRREVEKLLAVDDSPAFIHAAIGEQVVTLTPAPPLPDRLQDRYGRYKAVRRIGQGGMGAVYEAQRIDDFHKKVALKIVRHEFDSDFARVRFQQERQLLATLEHPFIARLIDGGESKDGVPYLVLEFVDGVPLNEYCRDLDRGARLRLFLKVCDAVEHAHRNLVIHRDLKPANILVTAAGDPKLLDFGIAKLLDSDAARTQTAMTALTPDYASPEQVRGMAITTASDVYALGVILYQLLTNRKPYKLESITTFEMDRVICEQPPAPPGLNDELDHILMMALRKEPERRYGSVQQFADDIKNFLAHRRVLAQPDTAVYRTRKYVQRHWGALLAATITLIAVLAGAGAALYQARQARQQFNQVRKLAHRFVFDFHDQIAKLEGSTRVREQMVGTALEYLDNLSANAQGDLSLQKEMAAAYQKVGDAQGSPAGPNLGRTSDAISSYRKAAAIHELIASGDPRYRAELDNFYIDFAQLLRLTGDQPGAQRMGEQARQNLERLRSERPEDNLVKKRLGRVSCLLGDIAEDRGLASEAYRNFHRCGDIVLEMLARDRNRDTLEAAQTAQERVGTAARAMGYLAESLRALDEDERLLLELLKLEPGNPQFQRRLGLLAQFRASTWYDDNSPNQENPTRCLQYAREYLALARQRVAKDPHNASAQLTLAIALFRLSFPLKITDPSGAVESARESVRLFDEQIAMGRTSYLVTSRRARALRRLSEALLAANMKEEALSRGREAVIEERKAASRDALDLTEQTLLAQTLVTNAQAAEAVHDLAAASALLLEAETISAAVYAKSPREVLSVLPLADIKEFRAGYAKRRGDLEQAHSFHESSQRLWREIPDQSEFVRKRLDPQL